MVQHDLRIIRADGEDPSIVLGTYGNVLLPRRFRLGPAEIASHKHLIGLTGQGKSRMELLLFLELLSQGVGVSLIDPHRTWHETRWPI